MPDLREQFKPLGITLWAWPDVEITSKRLLLASSGWCVWQDMVTIGFPGGVDMEWDDIDITRIWKGDVMCVNDMMMHFPGPVLHGYSNDDRWIQNWANGRREQLINTWGRVKNLHTCQKGPSTMNVWPWPGNGTSALGAVYTGLALGYEEIVLAGIPLDNGGHYFDPPWVRTNFVREVPDRDKSTDGIEGDMKWWKNAANHIFRGRVKAVSGRLTQLLPKP